MSRWRSRLSERIASHPSVATTTTMIRTATTDPTYTQVAPFLGRDRWPRRFVQRARRRSRSVRCGKKPRRQPLVQRRRGGPSRIGNGPPPRHESGRARATLTAPVGPGARTRGCETTDAAVRPCRRRRAPATCPRDASRPGPPARRDRVTNRTAAPFAQPARHIRPPTELRRPCDHAPRPAQFSRGSRPGRESGRGRRGPVEPRRPPG